MLKGFREFIMRGNVVDLAVAVVIGAAFGAVVNAFVKDILTPLVAAIFGKPDFSDLKFKINHSEFLYGDLINHLLSFLFIAAAIYFFVVVPLNKLAEARKRRLAAQGIVEEEDGPGEDIVLLTEIRDALRGGSVPQAPLPPQGQVPPQAPPAPPQL